jgi:hypothetical protein
MKGEGISHKTFDGDFRYYMHQGTAAFSFELAGRLSDDGARELQQAWRTASSIIGDRSLIVDLSYVTGIDVFGRHLLRGWHDWGAQLVATFPETRVLVQLITGQSVSEISATARHPTWLPLRLALWPLRWNDSARLRSGINLQLSKSLR